MTSEQYGDVIIFFVGWLVGAYWMARRLVYKWRDYCGECPSGYLAVVCFLTWPFYLGIVLGEFIKGKYFR